MRAKSISTRFKLAFAAIVTALMAAFGVVATTITVERISDELDAKLENYLRLSSVSLDAPLWNFDHRSVGGYLNSLMLDESLVYLSELSGDGTVIKRTREGYEDAMFEFPLASGDFVGGQAVIEHQGGEVGRIELVISRAALRDEMLATILAIALLTLLVIATVTIASVIVSQRYITRPLARLQQSTDAIGAGELQTEIDTSSQDEIGALARAFDTMRNAIRQLVGELKQSNSQLAESNQLLEDRVEQRTSEVVAAQEKLVDAIESASEGFAFYDAEDRLMLYNSRYLIRNPAIPSSRTGYPAGSSRNGW